MQGNGDSEIALVVEDTDLIKTQMNGKPVGIDNGSSRRLLIAISLVYGRPLCCIPSAEAFPQ
jgi:hypothetical protein